MLFQAALSLRELGILEYLDHLSPRGAALQEIARHAGLDEAAAGVLVDMGLSGCIIYRSEGLYYLTKAGSYLQNDPMTRVYMDFVQ